MIKVIDTDKLFDDYISDYVYKNIGKVKPEEIENQMPVLYEKFGDEPLVELDGKTPNAYYSSFTAKELIACLKEHVEKDVPTSDFLLMAILKSKGAEDEIAKELQEDSEEEFTLYLMNILSDLNSDKAFSRYMEFILSDYPDSIKELATESLGQNPDLVVDKILASFNDADKTSKARFCEILSGASRRDEIFEILINEFVINAREIPIYAGYLAKYGDERALAFLETAIENEKLSYADFEELRFAIEALGGEVKVNRDFTKDKTFRKITEKPQMN